MKRRVEALMRRLGLAGCEAEIARGHKIRFRRAHEPIADGSVLLAGDAAGLADEFTQEGIFYAVESGRLAARAILRALGGDGSLDAYERDVDAQLMPNSARRG